MITKVEMFKCDNCGKEDRFYPDYYGDNPPRWIVFRSPSEFSFMGVDTYHICSFECLAQFANKKVSKQQHASVKEVKP